MTLQPVFRTHQKSQQTITSEILTLLDLSETGHAMLFWATKSSEYGNTMALHVLLQCVAMLSPSSC